MSPDQTIIYAGSGYTGGGLQKIADSVGRSVVAGIDIAPGITGLTTLGGYTHFSQLHGQPADNIVNFEVVLGNSTVVNANATHNTGLYRGLRGGGNNFGIVTRLDLRTSPV
jgi:FAD/FMN-containing dehydrogenase